MKINQILEEARNRKCSDVHLSENSSIRFRKNGELIVFDYPVNEIRDLIVSMLNDNQKEQLSLGKDVDFTYESLGKRHRVNVYKEQNNLCAAIRIINDEILGFNELNLPPVLRSFTTEQRGLVLVSGPTGSGKSTTLAAIIDEINKTRNCHILTIEDPIEYVYAKEKALIHQREIERDVEGFDVALRSAMREDPDVILVGEMRDYETIAAVITLAETGHLVFSTLHTVGAAKTIDRIIDVFPKERQGQVRTQLSGVLHAVVSQQLILNKDETKREAAFEIMIANDAIKNLIRENKCHQINSIIQTSAHLGMLSLNESLSQLVKTNRITKENAYIYSNQLAELKQMI